MAEGREIAVEEIKAEIPAEFVGAPSPELKNFFTPFDGEWMPDNDPIEIGVKNYKTLQNYRYAGDKVIHLESVLGYTKINTTVIPNSRTNIRNGHQLRSQYTKKTYVLVHAEHATPASNYSQVYQNQTAIPSQGDFETTALHTDPAYSLEGRFSDAPGGQVAYTNGKESCIWAGEEMRCAAVFGLFAAKIVGVTDIDFNDNGAGADTIVDGGAGFLAAGFKAGHTITVSGTTNNNGEFVIVSLTTSTITLVTAAVVDEQNTSATITVSIKKDHINARDYTDAINNEINSAVESMTLSSAVGNFWLVLSTRPLKAIKYYVRTANGSASTTTCKYWDGDGFTAVGNPSDATKPATIAMAVTGIFSFDSTVAVAKPMHFEGLYLYAYLFELSAGSPVIYNITLDAPFQDMVDIWDGVYRQPIQCQVGRGYEVAGHANGSANLLGKRPGWTPYNYVELPVADGPTVDIGNEITANGVTRIVIGKRWNPSLAKYIHMVRNADGSFAYTQDWWNGGTGYSYTYGILQDSGDADYKDFTLEANERSFADYPIGVVIDGIDEKDHILVGFEERMSALKFNMIANLVNKANNIRLNVQHWTGTTWQNQLGQADSTAGLPGTAGVNKSFNRTGTASWNPPAEQNEYQQTIFGINAWYYRVTVSGAVTGTEGDPAEVVIDTIVGIPAQKKVNPVKFSVQYKNRLMLCGYTEGQEGNRIDYSVTNAPDVLNGEESSMEGIQSLYVGGKDDLIGAIELFNRFGSNIISCLLLFKRTETYLLTGDGPDNYRLYTISKTIGCPAALTLAAAEIGYTFAEEINRNIVKWMSYSGPMIFDGAAIVPVRGIQKYFDPAKATRLETSAIERCRGWPDNTYKESNLVIPSASEATDCNVWLTYDLVRKRWFEKEPGASEIPQAAWPVVDTDGKQYIYAGIDDGFIMRLENGNSWADASATAMAQVIETGDFFPSGDPWDITSLRRVKTVVKKIAEAAKNLAITWYKDTEASGVSLTAHDLDAGDPISKFTQPAPSATPLRGWTHRFKFAVTTTDTPQLHPIGWGYQYFVERQDVRDV